jgi:hypothetical protein
MRHAEICCTWRCRLRSSSAFTKWAMQRYLNLVYRFLERTKMPRSMGQWLSERMGQPFIIENRRGAASNISTEAVVRAPPDGGTSARASVCSGPAGERIGFLVRGSSNTRDAMGAAATQVLGLPRVRADVAAAEGRARRGAAV